VLRNLGIYLLRNVWAQASTSNKIPQKSNTIQKIPTDIVASKTHKNP
jgi:hypothetical protein